MHIAVHWESTYRYSEPVRLLHTELRVLPANGFGQRRLEGAIELTPAAHPHELRDAFGNAYHHVDFLEEVDQIHVAVSAEVETRADPGEEPAEAPPGPLVRYLYGMPTARAPHDPAIAALFDAIPGDLDAIDTGRAIADLIHGRFIFEVGSTDVAATALDLIRVQRGVCQDFSHLMLAALRLRGIPARYVSGYLAPLEGEESAEASHAWVQLLAGDRWWGFDAANDLLQDERYVITAVGRDYDDAPPLRGTYAGVATEEWSTTLRVRTSTSQQ
jgi:transglutaminase-like putative cysteine protease